MKRTNSLKCQLATLAVAAMVGSAWAPAARERLHQQPN